MCGRLTLLVEITTRDRAVTSGTIEPKLARESSQQGLELTAVYLLDVGLKV